MGIIILLLKVLKPHWKKLKMINNRKFFFEYFYIFYYVIYISTSLKSLPIPILYFYLHSKIDNIVFYLLLLILYPSF
jgi:hypothetical protein